MFRSIIPYVLICLGFTLIGLARDMPFFDWEISEIVADIPPDYQVKPSPWTIRLGESVLGDSLNDGSYLLWQVNKSTDQGKNVCSLEGMKPIVRRSQIDDVLERVSISFYENVYPWLRTLSWLLLLLSGMYVWGFAILYKRPVYEPIVFTILITIMFCIFFENVWRPLSGRVITYAFVCDPFTRSNPYSGTITFSANLSKVHYEMLLVFGAGVLAELGALGVMFNQIKGAVTKGKESPKVKAPHPTEDQGEIR